MNEVLIAAIAGPVLVLFISELFRYLNSKTEKEERFFYEVFPKRMELYEEIVRATNYIGDPEIYSQCKTTQELTTFYKEKCNILAALGFRCHMFGSSQVAVAMEILYELQTEISEHVLDINITLGIDTRQIFFDSFTRRAISIKGNLLEFIRKESGTHIIDNKIANFSRALETKQRFCKKMEPAGIEPTQAAETEREPQNRRPNPYGPVSGANPGSNP